MSYLTLLEKDNKTSNQLVVLNPRRKVDGAEFTSLGSNRYSFPFSFGEVVGLRNGSTDFTLGTSSSVTSGQFFYDRALKVVYFNTTPLPDEVIITYQIYAGTEGLYWHKDPLDTATPLVYYEPLISDPASNAVSSGDILQGFFPRFSTSISLINTEGYFQNQVYDTTFNRAPISVYHYVGDLSSSSIALFLVGQTGEISYSTDLVSFKIFDNTAALDDDFYFGANRVSTLDKAELLSFGSILDPAFDGSPIRSVIGYSPMVLGVNFDYDIDDTNENTSFGICQSWRGISITVDATVLASPTSDLDTTYVDSTEGFNKGDGFWHPSATLCTVLDKGSNFLEHTPALAAAVPSAIISRPPVTRVYVEKEGRIIPLNPLKVGYPDGTGGFETAVLTATISGKDLSVFEITIPSINIGPGKPFPDGISATDRVYATVYGDQTLPEYDSVPFGVLSSRTASVSNPVVVILDTLLNRVGIPESAIDIDSFNAALITTENADEEIGFITPEDPNSKNLSYRDIFTKICSSSFLKLFLDYTGKYKIYHLTSEDADTFDYTITDDEIIESSFTTDIDYSDLATTIKLNYARSNAKLEDISLQGQTIALQDGNNRIVYKSNPDTVDFEQIEKSKEFTSYHFDRDLAIIHAEKLSKIYGQAIIRIRVTVPISYYPVDLSNRVKIIRKNLIGFDLDPDILRERIFLVSSVTRSLDKVELELEDLKAIRENAALFSGA
jgi:hypothetical protein